MSAASDPLQQAKHSVTVLAGPYGHPIHPILVTVPAERHLPVAVVVAHRLLAATTLVLVLLTAIGIGGS